jgi:hypothetical protein
MHHNTSLDVLSTTFIKTTCKGQAWVSSKYDFAGNSWWHVKQVEQGSMDMTQSKKYNIPDFSRNVNVCKIVNFQNFCLNLSAYLNSKDAFLEPFLTS